MIGSCPSTVHLSEERVDPVAPHRPPVVPATPPRGPPPSGDHPLGHTGFAWIVQASSRRGSPVIGWRTPAPGATLVACPSCPPTSPPCRAPSSTSPPIGTRSPT